jgi:hypothetical protein
MRLRATRERASGEHHLVPLWICRRGRDVIVVGVQASSRSGDGGL